MEVITEADYNDRLREEADVAMIAGKYEDLLDRFQEQINEQQRIEEKLAELQRKRRRTGRMRSRLSRNSPKPIAEQTHLNERLEQHGRRRWQDSAARTRSMISKRNFRKNCERAGRGDPRSP